MSEHENAQYIFKITGIDCPHCAAKLQKKIEAIEGIDHVDLSYENSSLVFECAHDRGSEMREKVVGLISEKEPEAMLEYRGHKHLHHDHEDHEHECSCGEHHHRHDHEHHHHHDHECSCEDHDHHDHDHEHECSCAVDHHVHIHEHHHGLSHHADQDSHKLRITGIDCADCAARLEHKLSQIEGIRDVSLSFMSSSLVYECEPEDAERISREIREITAHEEPDAVIEEPGENKGTAYRYRIADIDCADCAASLAYKAEKIEGVISAEANFMNESLTIICSARDKARIEKELIEMIAREEPDVKVSEISEASRTRTQKTDEEDDDGKAMLIRLIAGAVLFVTALFLKDTAQTAISLLAWLVLGYDVLLKAVKGIGRGQVFDEHFLMAIATIAAIYLGDYREAAGVMLFYQIGEYFQDMAVRRSRRSIGELLDIRPDYAYVQNGTEFVKADPQDVHPGDIVRVKPGERIPLDGVIVKGASFLNTSALTGESKLQDVDAGDEVISGAVNESGVLEIRVTKEYSDSTVARILELVENSDSNKASHEKFITKFSRWYTPVVVFSAIAVALFVAVFMKDVNEGVRRACTFLVISCPCALVISIPLSFFAGIGGLSSKGVLVKGANIIEILASAKNIVMDKTGTLTTGRFAVEEVRGTDNRDAVLRDAAYAEHFSNHPLALEIREAYSGSVSDSEITDVQEIAGRGMKANAGGHVILAGNYKLMKENNIDCEEETVSGTHVYVARDGVYEGCLILRDQMKENSAEAVRMLHDRGCSCMIVSGDRNDITEETGRKTGADQVFAQCLPADKVEIVERLKKEAVTLFVGDGVNDAPVLKTADAGIAMGALGSDAAIEAADVVIMDDSLEKISMALSASRRILKVASQNIYGAIIIKVATLILGAFGIANMWMAIFADTGVAMLCVLNSLRLLKTGNQ